MKQHLSLIISTFITTTTVLGMMEDQQNHDTKSPFQSNFNNRLLPAAKDSSSNQPDTADQSEESMIKEKLNKILEENPDLIRLPFFL